jgi:hypothetical protein
MFTLILPKPKTQFKRKSDGFGHIMNQRFLQNPDSIPLLWTQNRRTKQGMGYVAMHSQPTR